VQVSLERVNSHLEVCVTDDDEGIKPDLLPHLFERFRQGDASTTRRHGGLGLGLSIVKQLVELHGGSVRAKSPGEGHGATFVVVLPVLVLNGEGAGPSPSVHPASSAPGPSEPQQTPLLSGLRVLVVDDEPDARELLRRLVQGCGTDVAEAGSAGEALSLLREGSFGVIVSDIGMPDMDGYDFIRAVRTMPAPHATVPAIALTAFARAEDRTRAMLAGYQMHLSKPIDPAELVAAIATLTGRTGAGHVTWPHRAGAAVTGGGGHGASDPGRPRSAPTR
jgi:CheY-like chemotaxis protein